MEPKLRLATTGTRDPTGRASGNLDAVRTAYRIVSFLLLGVVLLLVSLVHQKACRRGAAGPVGAFSIAGVSQRLASRRASGSQTPGADRGARVPDRDAERASRQSRDARCPMLDRDYFTVTVRTFTEVAPLLSVTVRVTVKFPALAYVWLGCLASSTRHRRSPCPRDDLTVRVLRRVGEAHRVRGTLRGA